MKHLPPGWVGTTIEALVDRLQYGYTAKAEHGDGAQGPAFLRITDIADGIVNWSSVPHCIISGADLAKYRLENGDLVFARTGSIEKACLVKRPPEAVFASYLIRGRPVDNAVGPWLGAFVGSFDYRNQVAAVSAGIGRANVNAKNLGRISLSLPPLSEQRRIVEAIESYFTRLDDSVATLERVQRNLKRYRASVLKAAVEGRLVPTEAELARAEGRDYEPASVLLERILTERRRRWEGVNTAKERPRRGGLGSGGEVSRYKEAMAPDSSGLPRLPEGWCWASIDQLTSRVTSGSRDWTQYYNRGASVFLMAQNIRPGYLDLAYQQTVDPPPMDPSCERSQVQPQDLLVTIVGANTGNVCRVPIELPRHYVCQSVALMRPVEPAIACYVSAYLNSPGGQAAYAAFMYGQGRPHLSFDNLRETPIPLPPLAEQARIVAKLDRLEALANASLQGVAGGGARCHLLRQLILRWAFVGRLVDQDPTDEPASVLLGRLSEARKAEGSVRSSRKRRAGKARSRQ